MVDVLNHLRVDYVVLGNHEFDFGEDTLQELLERAAFTTFGSNIRLRDTGALLAHTTDTRIVPLANGVRLGLFGVCTVATTTDSFATPNVAFESEVAHAKRCVESLRSQGADVVVALTHVRLSVDKLLAQRVPGIDLILGGHDHEPMSLFQGTTLIHKSGQDALWLGSVQLNIHKQVGYDSIDTAASLAHARSRCAVTYNWSMLPNRGYCADPDCAALLQVYADRVERENEQSGCAKTLAVSLTPLDATRSTCRSRESNLGNIITDAMRDALDADIAVMNGGYIRGERLYSKGLKITKAWLATVLSYPNPTCVLEMRVCDLRDAMLEHLSKYPDLNAAFLQISGVAVVYDIRDDANRSLRLFRDASHKQELALDAVVRVATSSYVRDAMVGFETSNVLIADGPIVPDVVASFVERHQGQIAYPLHENRIVVLE